MKNHGFTLAEVLITLGIISVIAAITIPGLINSYKAKHLRSQFLKSYSTIQQAIRLMISEDITTDVGSNINEFANNFSKFLSGAMDCTQKSTGPCYGAPSSGNTNTYKNLQGTGNVAYYHNVPRSFAMPDGSLIMLDVQALNVIGLNGEIAPTYAVDLNGYNNKPNRWGYDVFAFQFTNGELLPVGHPKTVWSDLNKYCSKNSTDRDNGFACAQKAVTYPDYFKDVVENIK